MRLTNTAYTGPVVRLRDPSTDEEADFYTDTTQSYLRTSDGVSVDDFPGRKVVVWYDQSLNANHMTQYIKQLQPTLAIDEESGLYTVGIFNVTSNQDSVPPDCYMDITTPVHPQQFAIIAKFREVTGYGGDPSSIFSGINLTWRLQYGSIYGGSNASDWVSWPLCGSTTFKVNGTSSQTTLLPSQWYTITSYHTQTYFGSDMSVFGSEAQGLYQIPKRSANAYVYEFGFLDNTTMATNDASSYFFNRQVSAKFPPQALTGSVTTLSGNFDGNGQYTVAASSRSSLAWQAFGSEFGYSAWRSDQVYNATTGVYTGSASIGGYSGEYLTIQMPQSIKLKRIDTRYNFYTQTIHVLGSNDGVSWNLVYTIERITTSNETFFSNATTAYSQYAFVSEKLTAPNGSGYTNLGLVLFYYVQ